MDTLIPANFYNDPEVFRREQQLLFQSYWYCVGVTDFLPTDGCYITRTVGGVSVAIRNFGGAFKAFRNVCSHRFNRIHSEKAGCGPFQCAYHGWRFDSAGRPSAIPKRPRFDDLDEAKLCALALEEWRVETCGRLLFVSKSAAAPSLREFLGNAYGRVEAFTNALGPLIDENIMPIKANWKILVENTLESYHVGFIHPTTFSRLGVSEGEFEFDGPHSSWVASLNPVVIARMQKMLAILSSRPVHVPGYVHQLIFPNVTIATTQGASFSVQFFEPVDENETLLTSLVFQTSLREKADSTQAALDVLNSSVKQFNRAVFAEDKGVCENVHQGTKETVRTGILSDEEERVGHFQRAYMEALESR